MPGIAGWKGRLSVSKSGKNKTFNTVLYARDMTVTVDREDADVTSYNSKGWREKISVLANWEASAEIVYNYNADDAEPTIWNAIENGSTLWWRFIPDHTSPLGQPAGWKGSGFLTNFEVSVPLDDAVTIAITIMGAGPLSILTLKA